MAGLGPAQILKADCHGFSAVMLRTEDSDGHECAHDEMLVPRQSRGQGHWAADNAQPDVRRGDRV